MKQRSLSIAFFVVAVFASSARESSAQVVSAGPYYATPSWDQKLACDTPATCPRFIVLANWNNEAVLDRETGLVWERAPLAPCTDPRLCVTIENGKRSWVQAHDLCQRRVLGNRAGWRLPSLEELTTLHDLEAGFLTGSLPLPPGHPFIGVQPDTYWTNTPDEIDSTRMKGVAFVPPAGPKTLPFAGGSKTIDLRNMWCVRTGAGNGTQ